MQNQLSINKIYWLKNQMIKKITLSAALFYYETVLNSHLIFYLIPLVDKL